MLQPHWPPSRCLNGQALPPTALLHLLLHLPRKLSLSNVHARLLFSLPRLSLERPSWTTPPKEGPSLDTVIVCPGSFKALTTIKIILLNCLLLFIHQPHIVSPGASLQTQNNSRCPPHQDSYLTGLQRSLDVNFKAPDARLRTSALAWEPRKGRNHISIV